MAFGITSLLAQLLFPGKKRGSGYTNLQAFWASVAATGQPCPDKWDSLPLTNNNNCSLQPGVSTLTAPNFNGTTQYLQGSSQLYSAFPVSFAFWFRLQTISGSNGGIVTQTAVGYGHYIQAYTHVEVSFDGSTHVLDSSALTAGMWYFCVVTYDGTTCKIYLNNSLSTSGTLPNNATFGSSTLLGALNGAAAPLYGILGNFFGIFPAVLSQANVTTLWGNGNGCTLAQAQAAGMSPTHWYDLTETGSGANPTFADKVGSVTMTGQNGPFTYVSGIGGTGNSTGFMAASSQSLTSNSFNASGSNFGVTAWINPSSFPSFSGILGGQWGVAGTNTFTLRINNGAQAQLAVTSDGTTETQATVPTVLSANKWYFVAGWYDGTNIWCQLNNGTPVSAAFAGPLFSHAGIMLGSNGNFWNGLISDGNLYLRGFTASDLVSLYNNGVPLPFPY